MKQAVVLIHGVGEQVPMDTLRGFVEAVWTTDESLRRPHVPAQAWSKPDQISGDFELRRLTTAENRERRRTDFFEFYWAHLMEGTTLSHVGAWAKVLLFRWPWRVPRQLRAIWWALVILLVVGGSLFLGYGWGLISFPPGLLTAVGAAWLVLGSSLMALLIHVAGDAARYLHVAPPNIDLRRRVREAGIDLLEKLHQSGHYDRIILVGHSLGSVIGYDILTHLWPRYHDVHVSTAQRTAASPPADATALQALEALIRAGDLTDYQKAQSEYLAELQRAACANGAQPWLVSDFVTLGSPLAHADVLLARNGPEFARKQAEREFPTCPPVREVVQKLERCSFPQRGQWVPHHAAVFAPTRWTNLYFPCRGTLWGDVIGGRLAPHFGSGIRDVATSTTRWRGWLAHTHYWPRAGEGAKDRLRGITDLRQAVRLCLTEPSPISPGAIDSLP